MWYAQREWNNWARNFQRMSQQNEIFQHFFQNFEENEMFLLRGRGLTLNYDDDYEDWKGISKREKVLARSFIPCKVKCDSTLL